MSSRNTPQRSTYCRSDPPACRIARTFCRHCSVWLSTSGARQPTGRGIGGALTRDEDQTLEAHAGRVGADRLREVGGVNGMCMARDAIGTAATRVRLARPCAAVRRLRDMIPSVPRFKLTLEYAGTRYSGWQKQKNARTVQGEIERAIAEVTGQRTFEFQGRDEPTAACMRCSRSRISKSRCASRLRRLRRQVNDGLPADINLLRIEHGARTVSCASCGRRPQLPLSDLPPPLGVRQAIRLVGEGCDRCRAGCGDAADRFVGHARLPLVQRR